MSSVICHRRRRSLGTSGLGSVYGAAGSLVVIVVWVYYSAQIVLFVARRLLAERIASFAPDDGTVGLAHHTSAPGGQVGFRHWRNNSGKRQGWKEKV